MSTRQLLFLIGTVTVLSAGLAWWLQRFELDSLHSEINDFLKKHDNFRKWEAEQNGD